MNTPYATLELTESSPEQSFTELFSRDAVKSFLGLSTVADPALDLEIDGYITGAREQAEIFQGRDLVVKQWDMWRDSWFAAPNPLVPDGRQYGIGNGEIILKPSLRTVDLIEYTDYTGITRTAVEGTDFVKDIHRQPGVIMPMYGKTWPVFISAPNSSILIRFTSGWTAGQVPQLVKQGMQLLISAWFNNKLPFELGPGTIQEYPMTVTHCLSYGAIPRVR